MEDWKYHPTYSGCPQGGIISPLLANIYLNELDKFAEKIASDFYQPRQRAYTPEYSKISGQIKKVKRRLKTAVGEEKCELLKLQKQLRKAGLFRLSYGVQLFENPGGKAQDHCPANPKIIQGREEMGCDLPDRKG